MIFSADKHDGVNVRICVVVCIAVRVYDRGDIARAIRYSCERVPHVPVVVWRSLNNMFNDGYVSEFVSVRAIFIIVFVSSFNVFVCLRAQEGTLACDNC